ncbi:hypothetical protein N9124_01090 [bacterium]|nr:hypothetical protein [bacterium]MDA7917202.1 hypothetical protein [Akkermansiaceae bacterium]MDB4271448.1 hypothetical protein [Akkermansiaceae bacterium]MDB4588062.1 hypothetical protein [bacterium]
MDKLICGAMRDHFSPDKVTSSELISINDLIANADWGKMSRKAVEPHCHVPPKSLLLPSGRCVKQVVHTA